MAVGVLSCRQLPVVPSSNGARPPCTRVLHKTISCIPRARSSPLPAPAMGCQRQRCSTRAFRRAQPVAASAAAAHSGAGAVPASVALQLLARAAAFVVATWRAVTAKVANKLAEVAANSEELDADTVNTQIKSSVRNMRTLMMVAPFAAISNGSLHTLFLVTRAVSSFIKLYLLLLFLRVLLSWFPAFNWEDQPWLALRQVTDPYLNLFRGLVPPLLGSIDFTPLFGFMILQVLAGVLEIQDEDTDIW